MREFRYALRRWRTASGSLIALVSVLGAAGGVASVIAAVAVTALHNPLRAGNPDTLIVLTGARLSVADTWTPATSILDYRDGLTSLRSVAAYGNFEAAATIGMPTGVGRAPGVEISSAFFEAMGITLAQGRSFTEEEEQPGRNRVVVLSGVLSQRAFPTGGAVGSSLRLNGVPFAVVGVAPDGFHQPRQAEFWIPIAFGQDRVVTGTSIGFTIIGRVPAGIPFRSARARFDADWAGLGHRHPDSWITRRRVEVVRAAETVAASTRAGMILLLALSGMLWAAACAAALDVVLGRAYARRGEFATYAVLGASSRHVMRHLAAEGAVLAALTATTTTVGVMATLTLVAGMAPPADAGLVSDSSQAVMFMAGLALSAVAGGAAMVPGALAFRRHTAFGLTGGRGAGTTGPRQTRWLTPGLVVGQTSIAFALVTGTLLLTGSLAHLQELEPGFSARRALSFRVALPAARYATPDAQVALFDALVAGAARLPGVAGAAAVSALPFERPSALGTQFAVPGETTPQRADRRYAADLTITADYFRVMGIPVIAGRAFDRRDLQGALPVVIVNAALAKACWGDAPPIGQLLVTHAGQPPRTVVGVVADVRQFGIDEPTPFQLYQPAAQSTGLLRTVVVDGETAPDALAASARQLVTALDPELAVFGVSTMTGHIAAATERQRFATAVTWTFALIALVLSGVAVYAALDRDASQRTREIAVRLAVGATARDVARLFLRRYVVLLLGGVALGAVWSVWIARLMRSTLPAVGPGDWVLWATAATILAACGLAGALVPTQRVARTDPAAVLRSE